MSESEVDTVGCHYSKSKGKSLVLVVLVFPIYRR